MARNISCEPLGPKIGIYGNTDPLTLAERPRVRRSLHLGPACKVTSTDQQLIDKYLHRNTSSEDEDTTPTNSPREYRDQSSNVTSGCKVQSSETTLKSYLEKQNVTKDVETIEMNNGREGVSMENNRVLNYARKAGSMGRNEDEIELKWGHSGDSTEAQIQGKEENRGKEVTWETVKGPSDQDKEKMIKGENEFSIAIANASFQTEESVSPLSSSRSTNDDVISRLGDCNDSASCISGYEEMGSSEGGTDVTEKVKNYIESLCTMSDNDTVVSRSISSCSNASDSASSWRWMNRDAGFEIYEADDTDKQEVCSHIEKDQQEKSQQDATSSITSGYFSETSSHNASEISHNAKSNTSAEEGESEWSPVQSRNESPANRETIRHRVEQYERRLQRSDDEDVSKSYVPKRHRDIKDLVNRLMHNACKNLDERRSRRGMLAENYS